MGKREKKLKGSKARTEVAMIFRTYLAQRGAMKTLKNNSLAVPNRYCDAAFFSFMTIKSNKPLWQSTHEDYQNKLYVPFIQSSEVAPKIFRIPDEELLRLDWSVGPFETNKEIEVPVFDLFSGQFINQKVVLYSGIFNQPLRRDLVHRAFEYYLKYDMSFTKGSIDQTEVEISNFFQRLDFGIEQKTSSSEGIRKG